MKKILPVLGAIGVSLALFLADCGRPTSPNDPGPVHCGSMAQSYVGALAYAGAHGGTVIPCSGVSMEPVLPSQAYVVLQRRPSIEIYDIVCYRGRPDQRSAATTVLLHRAVEWTASGWIMSGDSNRWSESWDRVLGVQDPKYLGTLVAIFEP